jgi:SpoU rRNA methylase family enzyme
VTGQKDQPHQEEILHQVLIKPKVPDHQKNITVKAPAKNDLFRHPEKAVMINLRAALAAARAKRKPLPEKAGHTAGDHQMLSHQVKKEHLPQKAGHIPEELLTMTQDREKALAVKDQAINLLHRAANRQQVHLMLMTGLKEALAAKDQAINLLLRAANHQQVHLMLMTDLKEALAVIRNSATGHQRAAGLKKQAAISHMMPTDHNAQNQHTIK